MSIGADTARSVLARLYEEARPAADLLCDRESPQGVGMVLDGLLRGQEPLGNLAFVDGIDAPSTASHDENRHHEDKKSTEEAPQG